jgi:chromosome partitioning protein
MMRRAECIVFANQKGGTGKTTTCISVAGFLAKTGNTVLVVDLDPHANATSGLGIDGTSLKYSMYDAILSRCNGYESVPLTQVIIGTDIENLHLAPSEPDLVAAEVVLQNERERTSILSRTIEVMRSMYDFILIDLPPTSGLLTINGICAADHVVIVLDPSIYSLEAFESLQTLFGTVVKMTGHHMDRITVVLNRYMRQNDVFKILFGRRTPSEEIEAALRKTYKEVFTIPESAKIFASQRAGIPISHYAPSDKAGRAYEELAKHIMVKGEG